MRFVRLTDYKSNMENYTMNEKGKAVILNGKPTYKLKNTKGLEWLSMERSDQFYSDWETVQPKECKYVEYYEVGENTLTIKPSELFSIRNRIQEMIEVSRKSDCKQLVLDYLKQRKNNQNISHVICQIDNSLDVADLHTIFNTPDVEKVVEGYSELFSGVFWNYIDEKDESCFQVPSMMIMDRNCMELVKSIDAVPYQRRKNGVDKITGQTTVELNPTEFKKLIESDLTAENAIQLVKIKNILDNPNFSKLIDDRINEFGMLENSNRVAEADKFYNELYIVSDDDKESIRDEILSNTELQNQLKQKHMQGTKEFDIYMATYVEMIEEYNYKKYFREREKEQDKPNNKDIKTNDGYDER